MRIITDIEAFCPAPRRPLILALGNFDGLHEGHRALLAHGIRQAREFKGQVGVFTFQEHPQQVLHPERKTLLLTSPEHKMFLLEGLGVDLCFLIPFTKEFSELEADVFVEQILVRRLRVHEVCLGDDARFGHGRQGNARLMSQLAARLGFGFWGAPPVEIDGEPISERVYRVKGLVEKPKPGTAPTHLAAVKEYVLTPQIFEILEKTQPGQGGEIWLADAIHQLAQREPVYACEFEGERYDPGNKLGFLQATVEYALARDDIGAAFRDYLKSLKL